MLVNSDKNISIYFGDALTDRVAHRSSVGVYCSEYKKFCLDLTEQFNLDHLVFEHQTHGLNGMVVEQLQQSSDKVTLDKVTLFERDGDWLVTNQKKIGLGVLTADCLPLVFYDKIHQAVGIAHAGWKGTVAHIGQKVIEVMKKNYGSNPADLQVFFGPSARPCCYEVGAEFEQYMTDEQLCTSLVKRDGKLFFDNACYNTIELLRAGVTKQNFNYKYHVCTICNNSFHSYRRSGKKELCQATIVYLNG